MPEWLAAWAVSKLASAKRPWVLGIQGPQGCGKSTLAAALVDALEERGASAVTVSLDDFYLTHAEQMALATRYPDNPTMQYRGYPGTHDVELGVRTLDGLASLRAGEEMLVPVYDKSAYSGRGDRAPREAWRRVEGPFDAVIFEGWMLGFAPVSDGRPHQTSPRFIHRPPCAGRDLPLSGREAMSSFALSPVVAVVVLQGTGRGA